MLTTDQRAEARDMGREAGRCAASWLTMSEDDARTLLEDIDPMVEDRYPPPNLSGVWADDPTTDTLYRDITGEDPYDADPDDVNALADEWDEGASETFYPLLEAHALRLIGFVDEALAIKMEHGA